MRQLKQALKSARPLLGSYCFTQSPAVIEVLGRSGLDFVIIDMEHSAIDWSTVEHMIRAAHLVELAALIRVRCSTEEYVYAALDAGADGIMLPFLRDAEQLHDIAQAARYYPDGSRHYCSFSRAWGYGTTAPGTYPEHARQLNENVVLFGIVESMETLDALPGILDVAHGLDAVALGRGDLATSLNVSGQTSHPDVQRAFEKMRAIVVRSGKGIRISNVIRDVTNADEVREAKESGVSIFVNVSETAMLIKAVHAFSTNVMRTIS